MSMNFYRRAARNIKKRSDKHEGGAVEFAARNLAVIVWPDVLCDFPNIGPIVLSAFRLMRGVHRSWHPDRDLSTALYIKKGYALTDNELCTRHDRDNIFKHRMLYGEERSDIQGYSIVVPRQRRDQTSYWLLQRETDFHNWMIRCREIPAYIVQVVGRHDARAYYLPVSQFVDCYCNTLQFAETRELFNWEIEQYDRRSARHCELREQWRKNLYRPAGLLIDATYSSLG